MTQGTGKVTYTSGEVAQILQVPARTIRRYLTIGRIPGKQNPITGTWTIERADLLDFMKKYHLETNLLEPPVKILVVDDEPIVSEVVMKAIQRQHPDWYVETITNGYEALVKTGSLSPHLMILDIHMPGTDGKEVLRVIKMRPEGQATKVLAMSGYPDELADMLRLGADDILAKPFEPDVLVHKVTELFKGLGTQPSIDG